MNGSGAVSAAVYNPVPSSQQDGSSGSARSPSGLGSPRVNQYSGPPVEATSTSLVSRSVSIVSDLIDWSIENRLGAAKLLGALVVPAQFRQSKVSSSQLLAEACNANNQKSGHVVRSDTAHYGDTTLTVAVCTPPMWRAGDTSRCVLYHNPNAATISSYFQRGNPPPARPGCLPEQHCHSGLKGTFGDQTASGLHGPGIIQDIRRCPVILYDYRGVGINKQTTPLFPTCETIVQDGLAALHYALLRFDKVEILGTSLGGAVATASLDRYPSPAYSLKGRVSISVLDSFSTTPHVMFPDQGPWIDNLGWLLGAYLDGAGHTDSLIRKGFKIAVSNHVNDEVIPSKAQLANHVLDRNASEPNVRVHLSGKEIDHYSFNHGSFTEDVQEFLSLSSPTFSLNW